MSLGLDTDVLVNWSLREATFHEHASRLIDSEAAKGSRFALAPQVLCEFIHVVSDPRRFEKPLTMETSIKRSQNLWNARDTEHVFPTARVMSRCLDLMNSLGLGRKRILDTFLAATLENAGIRRIATFNARDFRVFDFLDVIDPAKVN